MSVHYKFRGAQAVIDVNEVKDILEWHYGSLVKTKDSYDGSIKYFIEDENGESFFVNEDTIGQCLFINDKNGNELYEGDIVRLVLEDGEVRHFKVSIKKVVRKVVNHPSFVDGVSKVEIIGVVFEWNGFELFPCVDNKGVVDYSKMEKIGNVHENPELLEVHYE